MASSLAFCAPHRGVALLRHPTCNSRNANLCMSAPLPSSQTPSKRLAAYLARAEEGDPLRSLQRADTAFTALKSLSKTKKPLANPVYTTSENLLPNSPEANTPDFDIVIAGGTLGSLYATALQLAGWRVAIIERGDIQGRVQEWNISRTELSSLVTMGVVSEAQLNDAIVTECTSPGRLAFLSRGGTLRSLHVADVLNVGVAPDVLIAHAVANFTSHGGVLLERHRLLRVETGADCARLHLLRTDAQAVRGALGAGGTGVSGRDGDATEAVMLTTRLLMDAMGSFSPIAEQARGGRAPDGVCITVGSCMTAPWPMELEAPDIMVSQSVINAKRSAQYFWEAFPTGRDVAARTTYMFAYGACNPRRQTLTQALEDYLLAVEEYQGVRIEDVHTVKRVLFGFFPSYFKKCPTDVAFDRVLPIGDAGGLQSPISFGGFGCCVRHLPRICRAVDEALLVDKSQGGKSNVLKRRGLQLLQWYSPSLSVTGLFHKVMSVPPGAKTVGAFLDEFGINDVLWSNMKAMEGVGRPTQLAFLRDVATAEGLSKTLANMVLTNPSLALRLTAFIGVADLLDWMRHYLALVGYTAALPIVSQVRELMVSNAGVSKETKFFMNRLADGLTYGSGADALHD